MFWKKQPPPKPFYREKPVATAAVILTMVAMFVLAPVGTIYKGMTEELKAKADNKTVILLIEQIKENDARQWKEIEANRQQSTISAPKNTQIVKSQAIKLEVKKLTPTEYVAYTEMNPDQQKAYREYRTDITLWPK